MLSNHGISLFCVIVIVFTSDDYAHAFWQFTMCMMVVRVVDILASLYHLFSIIRQVYGHELHIVIGREGARVEISTGNGDGELKRVLFQETIDGYVKMVLGRLFCKLAGVISLEWPLTQ